jgi:HEXXH motif-containing protein
MHRRDGLPVKRGFSTPLCFGAIFLSFEDRLTSEGFERVELAIDLAHEIGHHVLHTFQTADSILSSNLREPVYSSVRRCVRPAIMSMHAAVALGYMLEAVECLVRANILTGRELNFVDTFRDRYASEQTSGLSELEEKCSFTSLGQRLMDALRRQVDDREVAAQPISCAPCLM